MVLSYKKERPTGEVKKNNRLHRFGKFQGGVFRQMLIFSVEAVFTFYRLKPAGLLLCPERQSNQNALWLCEIIGAPEKPDRLFGEEEAQRSGELFRKENDERSLC